MSSGAGPDGVGLALLNGFELRAAGERVELPASAQRLLAFLALQHRPVQRVYVAGVLWTDSSEERSLANLRSTLWRLRRPARPIVTAHAGLLQLPAEVTVDVEQLARLARDILEGRIECAQAKIESLLEGDLLPDWYEDWVVMERERLRHLRLHALEALCVRLAQAGNHWYAIEAGLAAVRADQLRESAHRALIEAYLAEGNTAEAVRDYRSFRALLRRELGLEPSRGLQRRLEGLAH
ncbi:MAG TPA: BTAD domain-containing putative transcriptional regulator [Solirubrobacterales bacterium]|nr:BTAD domain-containing putative transcriptional regulator [Solirubrobacterales bacterium]